MGRRRQERDLEDLLARTLAAGAEYGRREGVLSVLARIAARLFRREASEVSGIVSDKGPEEAVQTLGTLVATWAERWRDAFEAPIEQLMDEAPVQTNRGPLGLSFNLENPAMDDYFRDYLVRFSTEVAEGTRKRVTETIRDAQKEGLSVPETAERVRALGPEFAGSRANLVARQELQRSSKGAAFIKAQQSGVVSTKSRLSAKDARVRREHRDMDGETVAIDEAYSNGESFCGEKDFACRCVDIFGVDTEALNGSVA